MKSLYLLKISFALAFVGCSHTISTPDLKSTEDKVIATKENSKYKLTCLFYGEEVEFDVPNGGKRKENIIKSLSLRDDNTGTIVKYTPMDGPDMADTKTYFTDVWSPDGEYMILPRGHFLGFWIIKSSVAVESITKQEYFDFVRIQAIDETRLWHGFERWDDRESFIFQAGLSGDDRRFKYEISSNKLTSLDQLYNSFVGENNKGKIDITRNQ